MCHMGKQCIIIQMLKIERLGNRGLIRVPKINLTFSIRLITVSEFNRHSSIAHRSFKFTVNTTVYTEPVDLYSAQMLVCHQSCVKIAQNNVIADFLLDMHNGNHCKPNHV